MLADLRFALRTLARRRAFFAIVTILAFLGLVSVVASWIPARKAGRVAPAVELRSE